MDSSSHKTLLFYKKRIEMENLKRVKKLNAVRRNNRFTGIGLVGFAFGVYLYSIHSVQQETFLDTVYKTLSIKDK